MRSNTACSISSADVWKSKALATPSSRLGPHGRPGLSLPPFVCRHVVVDRAVRFACDREVEVVRCELRAVAAVGQPRLNCGDHHPGGKQRAIAPGYSEDHRLVFVQQLRKLLDRLPGELDAVDDEQHPSSVAGGEKAPDQSQPSAAFLKGSTQTVVDRYAVSPVVVPRPTAWPWR